MSKFVFWSSWNTSLNLSKLRCLRWTIGYSLEAFLVARYSRTLFYSGRSVCLVLWFGQRSLEKEMGFEWEMSSNLWAYLRELLTSLRQLATTSVRTRAIRMSFLLLISTLKRTAKATMATRERTIRNMRLQRMPRSKGTITRWPCEGGGCSRIKKRIFGVFWVYFWTFRVVRSGYNRCKRGNKSSNLGRSKVRTLDSKSKNQGSIPCRGAFYSLPFPSSSPSTLLPTQPPKPHAPFHSPLHNPLSTHTPYTIQAVKLYNNQTMKSLVTFLFILVAVFTVAHPPAHQADHEAVFNLPCCNYYGGVLCGYLWKTCCLGRCNNWLVAQTCGGQSLDLKPQHCGNSCLNQCLGRGGIICGTTVLSDQCCQPQFCQGLTSLTRTCLPGTRIPLGNCAPNSVMI